MNGSNMRKVQPPPPNNIKISDPPPANTFLKLLSLPPSPPSKLEGIEGCIKQHIFLYTPNSKKKSRVKNTFAIVLHVSMSVV